MSTPLSALIDAATDDDVPVSTVLRKLKVVAARLGTVRLEEWVDQELHGYSKDAELPDYRADRWSEVQGHFGGPFGSALSNAPIPRSPFPDNLQSLFRISFRQPISVVERLAESEHGLRSNWPADAVAYTNALIARGDLVLYGSDMGLQQAQHLISPGTMTGIVDAVRTRVVDVALALEAVEPHAGEPDAVVGDRERVEQVILHVFGGNVAVSSSQVQQQSNVTVAVGDRSALFEALHSIGMDAADLTALEEALNEDESAGEGRPGKALGPRVKAWVGDVAIKGGSAAAKGVAAGLGGQAVRLLAEYYGVGS